MLYSKACRSTTFIGTLQHSYLSQRYSALWLLTGAMLNWFPEVLIITASHLFGTVLKSHQRELDAKTLVKWMKKRIAIILIKNDQDTINTMTSPFRNWDGHIKYLCKKNITTGLTILDG